jgi:hypothetical protein
MNTEVIEQLFNTYLPGYQWMLLILTIHVLSSTVAHLKLGDFKMSEWPGFLATFLYFTFGIIVVNGATEYISTYAELLLPIRAALYTGFFLYYIDNISKQAESIGIPIVKNISPWINIVYNKVKGQVPGLPNLKDSSNMVIDVYPTDATVETTETIIEINQEQGE